MKEAVKILIVDDEEAIVNGLTFRLQSAGYQTIVAFDGLQAIEMASQKSPQLVLLDRCLPDLDGVEVLRRLKRQAETSGAPVILMSGVDRDRSRAMAEGAAAFLQKPYRAKELLSLIDELIGDQAVENRSRSC